MSSSTSFIDEELQLAESMSMAVFLSLQQQQDQVAKTSISITDFYVNSSPPLPTKLIGSVTPFRVIRLCRSFYPSPLSLKSDFRYGNEFTKGLDELTLIGNETSL